MEAAIEMESGSKIVEHGRRWLTRGELAACLSPLLRPGNIMPTMGVRRGGVAGAHQRAEDWGKAPGDNASGGRCWHARARARAVSGICGGHGGSEWSFGCRPDGRLRGECEDAEHSREAGLDYRSSGFDLKHLLLIFRLRKIVDFSKT